MPLYDFRCRACEARFEARTPAGGVATCPECASGDTERLLSPFAGPFTVAPRGLAAKRSNDRRRIREEQRRERKEERRRAQAERGEPPRGKPPSA